MARQNTAKRVVKKARKHGKLPLFAYPLVVFLLLCVGIYLVAWTLRTNAADVVVSAAVHGPAVTQPAVITSPAGGTHFTSIPITVTGTCPPNAAYVEIYRNNLMGGTAICDGSGNFQLSTDLFADQNALVAHVFNVTDDPGPNSSAVNVYYDVPQPPPVTTTTPGGTNKTTQPAVNLPILKTAFVYKGYYVGQKVEWPLEIDNGTPPYAVEVDWGDGSTDLYSRPAMGQFKISHTYKQSGNYKGSYVIKVQLADAAGNKAFIQIFVIVNTPENSGLAGNIFSKPPPSLGSPIKWLLVAWPAYILVVFMAASYWLGEREEIIVLKKRGLLRR